MATFTEYVTRGFSEGYYSGGAVSSEAPWKFDVALNGTSYLIDTRNLADFRHNSVRLLRPQQDAGQQQGESSVNPESWWTRSRKTWHLGAGQRFADDEIHAASPFRFYTSKGLNVWTEHQLSLMADTDQKVSSANTNMRLCPAGTRLYFIDGTATKFLTTITDDTPTLTTVTSTGSNTKLSICSDGFTIYFTDGTNVYTTDTTVTVAATYNALDCTLLAYVKGRLMAANANSIYNIMSASTPTALLTHSNTNFTWVGFAEGQNAIYAAGYSGDKSLIYQIALKADGTALDTPIVAATLPDGEIIRSIGGYLGFVLLGTDKGWRFCIADSNGNLTIGQNVATNSAVQCFEGQEQFVWYGLSNYDASSTGLGRMDIHVYGDPEKQQPAYASDLMVTGQGAILDVCTFSNLRVFVVSGLGMYAEAATLVTSGILQAGLLDFGLTDEKIALETSTTYGANFIGTHQVALAIDGSASFNNIGTTTDANSTQSTFQTSEVRAIQFELQHTLTQATSTTGPTVTGFVLRAQAAPTIKPRIIVPLLVFERMEVDGVEFYWDPSAILADVKSLNTTRDVVNYQEGPGSYSVIVDDYEWRPEKQCIDRLKGWQGCLVVALKVVSVD